MRASAAVAIVPPPPGRFLATADCPSRSSPYAAARAMVSRMPPADEATMISMGLEG
ncbi:Uncharacterised protein [Bordetella pertussis]|nr:Uncharacterised protein [Bordetella pertussis]CFV96945.1 Uncharacterised protein [Bordetella pertussis]